MLYLKNVPGWERFVRILAGVILAAAGVVMFKLTLWGYVLAASGMGFALTGFVGFCPMCAMIGRKPVEKGK